MTETVGYWQWTWQGPAVPPQSANLGIAFSGFSDPSDAKSSSAKCLPALVGTKAISIGGGKESTGAFTETLLGTITDDIKSGMFSDYAAIAFDVEEYTGDLREAFAAAFAATKSMQMDVIVTVSHSAPYGAPDAANAQAQMQAFFNDENISILSPQLYSSGTEKENDYSTTYGVEWTEYAAAKASVCPSIVTASLYASAVTYFEAEGVTLGGFIQWSQS